MIGLRYKGGKGPKELRLSWFNQPIPLNPAETAWVPDEVGERLLRENPRMFDNMGRKETEGVVVLKDEAQAEDADRELRIQLHMMKSRQALAEKIEEDFPEAGEVKTKGVSKADLVEKYMKLKAKKEED